MTRAKVPGGGESRDARRIGKGLFFHGGNEVDKRGSVDGSVHRPASRYMIGTGGRDAACGCSRRGGEGLKRPERVRISPSALAATD